MGYHFISHSSADATPFAQQLCELLESGSPSFKIWLKKRKKFKPGHDEIKPGRDWDEEIDDAIRSCESLLFIMSRDSVKPNSVCKEEWTSALHYKKPIIPLLLHEDAETPPRLRKRERIDFSGEMEPALTRLRNHLQWLTSPGGVLRSLQDRLLDAERDLERVEDEAGQRRAKAEIDQLQAQIAAQQKIVNDPEAAKRSTDEEIARGLEYERQRQALVTAIDSRFINPPPGLAPSYFQNRFIETKMVCDFLNDETKRLLTIVGRGGIGKTAMACRALKALEQGNLPDDNGPLTVDGIIYLSAGGSRPITLSALYTDLCRLLPEEVTRKLEGIFKNPQAAPDAKMEALLACFPKGRVVVLLDNFENVIKPDIETISDAELSEGLRALLQLPHHSVKIILTTRIAPRNLALIEPGRQTRLELDRGLESPYAEKILRAMDINGAVGLKDAPDELLEEAARRTLGYPRALEALFAILSVDRYTALPELLNEAANLLPDEVIEVLVGEAFSRLDPVTQKTMQALAIYGRPVTAAAVDYLLQPYVMGVNSAPTLNRLVNAHFVRKELDRYYQHPVDRSYALGRLKPGEASDDSDAGSAPFTKLALLRRGAEYFRQARRPRELWKTVADLAPQLAEIELRCEVNEWDAAALVLLDINYQLELWGHNRLKAQHYQRMIEHIGAAAIKADCQGQLGWAFFRGAEYEKAVDCFQNAIDWARGAGDLAFLANALMNLAACYGDMGQTGAAIVRYHEALEMFVNLGAEESKGICLGNLGFYLADLGQTADALDCHHRALEISVATQNRESATIDRANIGARLAEFGQNDGAVASCEQALTEAREIGYRYSESVSLVYLGDCAADQQDWPGAIARYEEARQIAAEIGNPQFEIHALVGLAKAHLSAGDLDQARRLIIEACKHRVPRSSFEAMVILGVIAFRQGEDQTGRKAFVAALDQTDAILRSTAAHVKALDAKALALSGLALCGRPDRVLEAIQTFSAARAINKERGIVGRVLRLLSAIAVRDGDRLLGEVRRVAGQRG